MGKYLLYLSNIYLGQWVNGKKNGKGIQLGVDNSCYYGEWKNGVADGEGVLVHDNGDRYLIFKSKIRRKLGEW